MPNGTIANKGKKLKKDNADFPNTKFTTLLRFIGSVSNGFTLITGNFWKKKRTTKSPKIQKKINPLNITKGSLSGNTFLRSGYIAIPTIKNMATKYKAKKAITIFSATLLPKLADLVNCFHSKSKKRFIIMVGF